MTLQMYYHLFYPRTDKLTGEMIPFKTYEQYFESDFISRNNMVKWLLENSNRDETKVWAFNALKQRAEKKGLKIAPCWLALKTLMVPSVEFFDIKWRGGYNEACKEAGLTPPFDYQFHPPMNINYLNPINIVVDTREQEPLEFLGDKLIRTKLHFGDYTAAGDNFDNVFIERKSLSDLLGTLSAGYDRFCRELERAREMEAYIVILCESCSNDFFHFPVVRGIHSKASVEFIHHRFREITVKFPNVQFLFVKGRDEAARCAKKILVLGRDIRQYDLQHSYHRGML